MSDPGQQINGTVGPVTVNSDNPWPGLLPFSEADQAFFRGRQDECDGLFRLVLRQRLSVLYGLSGLGKSSLLQAGLFPLLRSENIFPVYIRLDFSAGRPDLIAQVKEAIFRKAGTKEKVLSDFYERSVAEMAPQVRTFIEDRLLTVSGFRDSVAVENALNAPGISRAALDLLVSGRLVRFEDRGGAQRANGKEYPTSPNDLPLGLDLARWMAVKT